MPVTRERLAIEQTFSHLDIETSARKKLQQAAKAFWEDKLTESANLFLESWRILQNEYERNISARLDSLPIRDRYQQQQRIARENKGRMLLSLVALHDFARACSRNNEEYKDKDGEYKLKVCPPRYDWSGNTTTEELEIEENNELKPWPKGAPVTRVLPLKDTLGRLLEKADSFKDAALIIASFCSLQVACVSGPSKEHLDGCKFISDSLLWMRLNTSIAVEATKAASSSKTFGFEQIQEEKKNDLEEDGDEKPRKKLAIKKLKELKKKKITLSKEEENELIALFEGIYVTPYDRESFKQMQEESENNSEDDEEEGEKEGEDDSMKYTHKKDEAELIDLLEQLHLTGKTKEK